eukprot:TRINITY_DN1311_c0_g4_i1.p1 TRINITY_DN1311_c0_g4~~TRINITY_DN1311_c0_g4_i1.p1  ORF type:complete len:551 (+),score=261.44 TRINITY_DN1311_c0_g4_i1:81-1733(+)
MPEDHPTKRRRVGDDGGVFSIFNKATFEKCKEYASAHEAGAPYPHVRVTDLFKEDALRAIVEEAKVHLNTTFKETDLFKMFQTLDLANFRECEDKEIMELREKVPTIVKLRDALYSSEFRAFVRQVCGIDMELTERVDMAMQAYSEGGHLLCHDDVIGTRAVSFIIYLTDPDVAWTEEMGGELELYDQKDGLPTNVPSASILPTSNTMAMFRVTPGVTFHSVAETLTDEAPRLSLQGWFHAPQAPKGAEDASSISMLKDLKKDPTVFDPLPCPVPEGGLAEIPAADMEFLAKYIGPAYLKAAEIGKIRQRFAEVGAVQLMNFLREDVATKVLADCTSRDTADGVGEGKKIKCTTGLGPGFELQGSPVTQRYVKLNGSGMELEKLADTVMKSAEVSRLVAVLTGLRPLGMIGQCRRFRAGSDYTVAYHRLLEPDTRLDATLCFAEESHGWVTGDIGGFECYIAAESSELVAAEAYGNDDDAGNDLVNVNANNNTLSLVARDEQMMRFVKYVSAAAPGSRWDIALTYEIECDSDDEEDEECEEEDGEAPKGA